MFIQGWRKSSFSGEGNACLYLASTDGTVKLCESDQSQVVLTTTRNVLRTFIRAAKVGSFDGVGAE